MGDDEREIARTFLNGLHERLLVELPAPVAMRKAVDELVADARVNKIKHLNQPEYAFLNHFAVPIIFDYMRSIEPADELRRKALLSEFYRNMPAYHLNSPRRYPRHPFGKLPRDPLRILQRWRGEERSTNGSVRCPLHQACPDIAIGEPFPHRVVFEVKYFTGNDGERQLVNGVYEAFYYLAMPNVPASKTHPAWQYKYGCYLAFDASEEGSLHAAWHNLNSTTREGFWNGGNLFVMIVRPQ
ncbi:MAG: hypothetical protein ABSD08_00975 [Xanthobacteraceae bacterium]|jgi:hypothetical protein